MKNLELCLLKYFLIPDDFLKVVICNANGKEICAALDGDQICNFLKKYPENGRELFVWQISYPPANSVHQGNYLLAKM